MFKKTTHTDKDSLAERTSARSRQQGDRKWHDKCFKVNLTAPVQCYLQDRIMEHDHKQMATIFPGPVEASLESNETFTYAHELKRWKKAQQSWQNSCVTTSPSSALPLCPPQANHHLCLQSNWHSPMSSGKINSCEWLAMDLPAVCFLRTVSIFPISIARFPGPIGSHEVSQASL